MLLVVHTIVWRSRWRRKRRNMWVHPINMKRLETGIFSQLHPNLLENYEKFYGFFFRINIEQFHRLSQLVEVEIRKRNTNYRRAISPEWDYLFTIRALKIRKDKENILDNIGISFQARSQIAKSEYQLCHVHLSVCPSVRTEQLGSHLTDFDLTWYMIFFRTTVKKFKFL